jgi:2-C-methyl-D-erythritol 4-phosphate cytidylyltransferase/2-C-methyl-D-erythritol 2,4-cyclodiphosphate synthase
MLEKKSCFALIVAAGHGTRAGEGLPKQYRLLAQRPVLRRTVEAFAAHPAIDRIAVVISPAHADLYRACIGELDLLPPVVGGDTRQASVLAGLRAIAPFGPDRVLIHDAARALVTADEITAVCRALDTHDAAIPVLPAADTLKQVKAGRIEATLPREHVALAQTPQGFRFAPILAAHEQAGGRHFTDDAAIAEAADMTVATVPGSRYNMKLTTPEDFVIAERLLAPALTPRMGTGYDVHRFTAGDHVWLCGVRVPHDHGLEGHSDADVGLHALTDALLGAAALGDIGQHFPPSDPRWKGAASHIFLAHAASLIRARGGRIANVDVTLVCEAPKVSPHRDAMRARVAAILELDTAAVSVKATTTEGLGFTGRREGIAAQAIATVLLP